VTDPSVVEAAEPLQLVGRIIPASNATFVGELAGRRVVYKPIAGERPLWDFPEGNLASREVAAYAVSEALGWQIVPPTRLGEGPHGSGMVQDWVEPDPDQAPVDVVPAGEALPEGYCHVLDALDGDERPVSLIHEDTPELRRMAVFDVLINNGDRKGGHVLAVPGGHRHGVDHGVSFHVENKLRTVLWGWLGEPLLDEELDAVKRVRDDEALSAALDVLLTAAEVRAFTHRCSALLRSRRFPEPSGQWPAIPWPAF
jgi:uncharacterized repeat protein (TIGR03843 family)